MSITFVERLSRAQRTSGGLVCVGLDPDPAKLPKDLAGDLSGTEGFGGAGLHISDTAPLYAFNRRIVDATAGVAAAYKPQIAFYSALGAEDQLVRSIRYIRERAPDALVILDAKRSDIGNTAEAYAREAFDRYGADAVTVNPYMGEDSVRPFLARPDRGAILLCRTSNPGARDTGTRTAISCWWWAPPTRAKWPTCAARTPTCPSWFPVSARKAAISRQPWPRAWTATARDS
jgi:orotidine-5'-phosphate decarboxylase